MQHDMESAPQHFAIYTRISTDMQTELSLEAQEEQCRQAVAQRGGIVRAVFSDSNKSGWSLERDGFNDLRAAAEKGTFDAVMFWKFDRLARNHDHALMIKTLLRHEYGLKLYCVEGFSEDDDDSPEAILMEQMLSVFAAFYSKNLSNDAKRAKRQRAVRGEYNGSAAPLGYDLITAQHATDERPAGLYINPVASVIVHGAFTRYSSGKYSDGDIAEWMNQSAYIQQLRKGQKPINREMIRELLQNRTYTGRVPHTDTIYKGSMGQGKMSRRGRTEWFEGKHEGFISDELFNLCQQARKSMMGQRNPANAVRPYALHDKVVCGHCLERKPDDVTYEHYGRMRPSFNSTLGRAYYYCLAQNNGYEKCGQQHVEVSLLDTQVVKLLSRLEIPSNMRGKVVLEVSKRISGAAALERMEQIQQILHRIDLSWKDQFLGLDSYLEKRQLLQTEYERLRPTNIDPFKEADALLRDFMARWELCNLAEDTDLARRQLMSMVVEEVCVYGKEVFSVTLYGEYVLYTS